MQTRSKAIASAFLLSATASAADHVVTANPNLTFTPNNLTIAVGDTVTFRNSGGVHNVASDPGSITMFRCANGCDGAGGNGNLNGTAWSATVAFPTAGTIRYFCEAHGDPGGAGMAGVITVTAPTVVVRRSDFNGDGRSDILWRNGSTGANSIWRSASSAAGQALATVPVAWRVVGLGDYNGDGRSDLMWRNSTTGADAIWLTANSATPMAVTGVTNLAWTVVGSGDYNGDRRADILWRNTTTGANALWLSANPATPVSLTPVAAQSWGVVGFTE